MLIYRLPLDISLFSPSRSVCTNCNTIIKWYENIPVISYLLLRGKCSTCKNYISIIYPIVELLTGLITLLIYNKLGFGIELILSLLFFYTIIILSFIDLKYKEVPDYLLFIVFIISFFITKNDFLFAIQDAMILAGGFVLLNFIITFYIQNIKSRIYKDESLRTQEALGEGDIPVISAIGVILGLKLALVAIFLSALFAIIPAVYNNYSKKDIEIPFIPYLALGLFCTYIFKNQFINILG